MAWQTEHKLETVEITYHLPSAATGRLATMKVVGRASTKRAHLWVWYEEWDPEDTEHQGYEPSDAARHILLVVEQDRPNSLDRLAFGMTGGLSFSEDELPFS